ncbi:MAG: twin-arginine translocase TatA/TatE family subunit [Solirubrobacterales bacterium]
MSIGLPEVLIILLILLLIFGGRRIPQLGRALGTGLSNLRESVSRGSAGKGVEGGQGTPPPSSSEPVEEEEAAKRP